MKTEPTYTDAVTAASTALVFQYSDDPGACGRLLATLQVEYRLLEVRPYFEEDKEPRQVIEVRMTRPDRRPVIFTFGLSLNDTEMMERGGKERQEALDGILYSVLSSVRSDYHTPAAFSEFCGEYGYDEDSRKAYKLHVTCLEHALRLQRLLTPEEVAALPQ